MRAKKVVIALSMLLLTSVIMQSGHALTIDTVSFHGVGLTIDLVYPEEAHPNDIISHNLTVTAYKDTSDIEVTLFVYASINSTVQHIKNETVSSPSLKAGQSLLMRDIWFRLPQDANGTLRCTLSVRTLETGSDYSSAMFYSTQVRILTYSEVLSTYEQLLANYTALSNAYDALNTSFTGLNATYQNLLGDFDALWIKYNALNASHIELSANYSTLNSTYNSLKANLTALNSTYNLLVSQNTALQSQYDSLVLSNSNLQTNYDSLQANYNSLNGRNNALQSDYDSLNATRFTIEGTYNSLKTAYDALNATYVSLETQFNEASDKVTNSENLLNIDKIVMFAFVAAVAGLIALIIYLKKKEPEPYVVIRKETVSVKPDEKQQTQ